MTAPLPFADKVVLQLTEQPPVCPWCDGLLDRVHWHKVRGAPSATGYFIVLSCHGCRGVLDCAATGRAKRH